MYFVYSLLILLFGVVASPYLAYQAIRYRKYIGSLSQRMGYLPVSFNLDGEESIWIHAVSVGEVLTARALISDLKRRYPHLRVFLSTTTLAGQQVARRNVQDVDAVFYFPFDLAFIVRRTLRLVKPRLFIMMETEIWPNLLRACKTLGRGDGHGERAHFVALVSAIPAGAAVLQNGAGRRRQVLHAERRVGAPAHRYRRRSGARVGDRQPEVRFARRARRHRRSRAADRTACCGISG